MRLLNYKCSCWNCDRLVDGVISKFFVLKIFFSAKEQILKSTPAQTIQ